MVLCLITCLFSSPLSLVEHVDWIPGADEFDSEVGIGGGPGVRQEAQYVLHVEGRDGYAWRCREGNTRYCRRGRRGEQVTEREGANRLSDYFNHIVLSLFLQNPEQEKLPSPSWHQLYLFWPIRVSQKCRDLSATANILTQTRQTQDQV